jgi:hypothetical protein
LNIRFSFPSPSFKHSTFKHTGLQGIENNGVLVFENATQWAGYSPFIFSGIIAPLALIAVFDGLDLWLSEDDVTALEALVIGKDRAIASGATAYCLVVLYPLSVEARAEFGQA